MRVPLSWLGEWVDLPEDVTLEHVHAALVSVGFEEEDVHTSEVTGPLVVGQVLEFTPEPQTNGKTINWCQIAVGPTAVDDSVETDPLDVRGIVCGAHNFAVGDKVVVTLPGAVLPGPFPIAARKTYGHVSDGMMASTRELGLGDEHDGILLLKDLGLDDAPVGADAVSLLGLDDAAVEINVTPDRGYAFSIRGVAREYSHATGAAFRDPAASVTPVAREGFRLTVADDAPIRDRAGVSTFITAVVRGIDVAKPTPPHIQSRLRLAGMRSISLPVDITNYVMLEFGQPTHAYDLGALAGGITVRRAKPGEHLTTLDDVDRALDPEDLLITDDDGPIGLAGVMGGARTEVSASTTDVVIEAATFEPVSIARSARRHKLPSEASRRFERGVDPAVSRAAAERIVELLVALAGGTADTLGSVYDVSVAPAAVFLPEGRASSLIGVDYTRDEVEESLIAIGADVTNADGGWLVTPPTWRTDLRHDADLVEEVARITGYDRIPSVLPVAPPGRGLTREQSLRRGVASGLASAGLTEVYAYPFVSPARNAAFAPLGTRPVTLANPLDVAAPEMRMSLIPGLLDTARRNLSRGLVDLDLFETGSVYLGRAEGDDPGTDFIPVGAAHPGDETLAALNASLPAQPRHLAILSLGNAVDRQPGVGARPTDLADVLDDLRVAARAVAAEITVRQSAHPSLHPGRTADVLVGDEVVGFAGELLPAIALELDLPRQVVLAEIDLDRLMALGRPDPTPAPISGYPVATQDLSLVVGADAPAGEVLQTVVEGSGELLEYARLVDDYRGAGLEQGAKSLTFALRFRASDRTLTAAEASEAKQGAVRLAGERFGATLRD
ncbi:phenylalanine--tRNA ligase subunit beta [Frondihabitans sp. PAMC 28766]|uniref:phenylalanine--tRNA ligase subunit beta n=1 Tax=Frondihabitans sp. PAMC 28766 TaxID=1795630 RepID=UPI00078C15A1|nr:phenylalanine--tRNA ligase subunit beta [Frondihabitans sp. PAMC 28766]AMM20571.1 phenylalanine--tRNA ligase subunit beta [Frondihabitans sp. PAMC 28766]